MDVVTHCKQRATWAHEHFLTILSHVPEEKLTWSPAPTAKSALQIAAHCAGFSGAFANIIREGGFPWTVEEYLAPIRSAIEGITTIEQAKSMLRKGIEDSLAALDTVKPEQVDGKVKSPQGQTPFIFFMTLPAFHLDNHAAQIDYLQTCWDDQEVHLEPRS